MRHAPPASRPRRVAIVGGGLSGLTAAYELSRTEALRARYDVTVYTPGHRLGGKLASSRNAARAHRNEEQGLHVWFGFYENAFRLARELDARWNRPTDCPFSSIFDALSPQTATPYGMRDADGVTPLPLFWGKNPGRPGDGQLQPRSLTTPTGLLDLAWAGLRTVAAHHGISLPALPAALLERLGQRTGPARWPRLGHRGARRAHRLLGILQRRTQRALRGLPESPALREQLLSPVDFLLTCARGLTAPEHAVYLDGDLDRLDDWELRDWLRHHGAAPATLQWSALRFAYDACFQYLDGDRRRPNFAAGTALRILLRLASYAGAPLYLLNAGMGECFVGPLYEVLRQSGVRFSFFHRLEDLRLDAAGEHLEELRFVRQATLRRGPYRPTVLQGGLPCWPTEPDYAQLVEGRALEGIDLESIWSSNPHEREQRMRRGRDFDDVVLALPLGVLAGRGGKAPCAALLENHPRLRRAIERINLVPTVAAQLWTDRRLDAFGERVAMPSWAAPFDVLADMSPVVAQESWPRGRPAPVGCYYLCGVAGGTVAVDALSKAEAYAAAVRGLAKQLHDHGASLWQGPAFDWSVLHDPAGQAGPARLHAQFLRVNVEPSDLCDGGNRGAARHRLEAQDSGLRNLALAGTYLRTGINSTCVEAAVMAGMGAARAIHGELRAVIAEDFLARPFERGALPADRFDDDDAAPLEVAS